MKKLIINLPLDVKANGEGSTTALPAKVVCTNALTCIFLDCIHRVPHYPVKRDNAYRCDQYKRKDIDSVVCLNPNMRGVYCK